MTDDRGSVLILGLAGVVLVVAVLLVAVDIAALATARRGGELTADAAARAAVQAVDLDRYYLAAPGGGPRLPVDRGGAVVRARRVVVPPWRLDAVRVDDDVVSVSVTTDVALQTAGWFGHPTAAVTAVGSASLRQFGGGDG